MNRTLTITVVCAAVAALLLPGCPSPPRETAQVDSSAPQPAISSDTSPDISEVVYVTDHGDKYHRAGCRYLSESSRSMSLAAAQAGGYTPCKVCQPPP
ncbi:MAG: hypothetical protein JXA57_08390 [Armatimonadetes bacterium]|nr:hypothetical protein [Armatimonadota bacterium]